MDYYAEEFDSGLHFGVHHDETRTFPDCKLRDFSYLAMSDVVLVPVLIRDGGPKHLGVSNPMHGYIDWLAMSSASFR